MNEAETVLVGMSPDLYGPSCARLEEVKILERGWFGLGRALQSKMMGLASPVILERRRVEEQPQRRETSRYKRLTRDVINSGL
jgi:hypothetical protein